MIHSFPTDIKAADTAIVTLGLANTRIKDFFDIWATAQPFRVSIGAIVITAIRATFGRRGTAFPALAPTAMSAAFSSDPEKQRLWRAFAGDRINAHQAPPDQPIHRISFWRCTSRRIAGSLGS